MTSHPMPQVNDTASATEIISRIGQLTRMLRDSLLNGPQMDKTAAGVVSSQNQVDDLLDSLGF